jgi:hypothetical protein
VSILEEEYSMLPTVEFCGRTVTRLIIGANPFGGYSHQNPERDREMRVYYTPERIVETWERAWAAGINTMITNNETPHVIQTTAQYLKDGGPLQWIAQVNLLQETTMQAALDRVVEIGCVAAYLHGGLVDRLYAERNERALREYVEHGQGLGIPVGVAGHHIDVHDWVDSLDLVDFHAVPFFNCGSLRNGAGHQFKLEDVFSAVQCIQRLDKPCIAYKIMGSGRMDARMSFEYAFEQIKAGDVVNVGMYRGDKEKMVEENASFVEELIGS